MPLLQTYSAMTVKGSGTSNPGTSSASSYNITSGYNIVYHSSTTYKVAVNFASGSTNGTYTIWVLNDGTVKAVEISSGGQSFNITGSNAQATAVGVLAEFTLQIQANSQIAYYTNTGYFHTTGTSTTKIGPTTFSVTSYAANNLPTTIVSCDGSTTLTAYSLSVGTPQGKTGALVISEHFAGSSTDSSGTRSFDYVQQVTSVTLG